MKRILSFLTILGLLVTSNIALAAPGGAGQVLSIAMHTPQLMAAGTRIVPGTANVAFGRIDIRTAANSASRIDKIGIHMIGTSAAANALSNIRLVDLQGRVVGRVAAPFANGSMTIPTNGLVVNANSLYQLDVVADVTGEARMGTLGVAVDSMNTVNMVTGAKIGVFPTPAAIKNGTLADIVVGGVTVSMNPQPLSGLLFVSNANQVLGRIDVRASQAEDVLLNQVEFRVNGENPGRDVSNVAVYTINNFGAEVRIPTLPMGGNTYTFNGGVVRRGTTTTFIVKADCSQLATGGHRISMSIVNPVVATGAFSGQQMPVNANLPMVWPAQVIVNETQVTVAQSAAFLPAQNARMGDRHVRLASFQLTTSNQESIRLEDLTLTGIESASILGRIYLEDQATGEVLQSSIMQSISQEVQFSHIGRIFGPNTTLSVYADIAPADQAAPTDAVQIGILNAAHIRATGMMTGNVAIIVGNFPSWARPVPIVQ